MPSTHPRVIIEAASLPADGKIGQDRHFIGDDFVIVLDGASSPDPQAMDGGVYAGHLQRSLSQKLLAMPGIDLATALGQAIADVAQQWALQPGHAPASTVAIFRWTDTHAEGLVLGDSPIIAMTITGELDPLRDDRLADIGPEERAAYQHALSQGQGYGDGHQERLRRLVRAQRAQRNKPGGYWIAEAMPEAATHAIRKGWRLSDLRAVLIATDGLTRGIEQLGTPATWNDAFDIPRVRHVTGLLRLVHNAEATDPNGRHWPRSKPHDDKTAVLIRLWN